MRLAHWKARQCRRNVQRLKDVTDMETGQRGYLLTGDPSYLQPYADAKGRIGTDFADLRAAWLIERERTVPGVTARVFGYLKTS